MSDPVVTQPPQPDAQTFELTVNMLGASAYAGDDTTVVVKVNTDAYPVEIGQRVTVIVHPPEAEAPECTCMIFLPDQCEQDPNCPVHPLVLDWKALGMVDHSATTKTTGSDYRLERDEWNLHAWEHSAGYWLVQLLYPFQTVVNERVDGEREAFDLCAFLLDSAAGGAVPPGVPMASGFTPAPDQPLSPEATARVDAVTESSRRARLRAAAESRTSIVGGAVPVDPPSPEVEP